MGRPRLLADVLQTLVVEPERAWPGSPFHRRARATTASTPTIWTAWSSTPARSRGVRLALLFREMSSGRIKVSFRSVGVDSADLAQQFGGGGHAKAAGASLEGSLGEAQAAVLESARAYLNNGSS